MSIAETVAGARLSRRAMLQGAGAVGAGLALGSPALLRSAIAASESVSTIINVAATAEALAVTLLGRAIVSAKQNAYGKPLPPEIVSILEAARAEEQYHYVYLKSAGAMPLTTTFTIPNARFLSDRTRLFSTLVMLESAFIAAYMAAAREFAAMKQPALVKVAYQIGTVEAEHRALANYALGIRPANDVAFERTEFQTVGQAAAALKGLGFIGGHGVSITYPGPGMIDTFLVKNTVPDGPSAACSGKM